MTQKKRSGEKIKLISVDELLKVPDGETTIRIPLGEIHSFKDHPFRVVDDDAMKDLTHSIKHNGILTPLIVREDPNGGYEIISGHRRMYAANLLEYETVPAVVRNLNDDDATIIMVDANIQREELLPSEKAFAYKMRYEAMQHKVGRPSKESKNAKGKNASQIETNLRRDEELSEMVGESRAQIHRYIRLVELIPDLLQMVDNKQMAMNTAVEISYLSKEIQNYISTYIHENGMVKSYQISALRQYLQDEESISQKELIHFLNDNLMGKSIATPNRVTFTEKKLRKYFGSVYSMDDIEKIMINLLERWKKEQDENEDEI